MTQKRYTISAKLNEHENNELVRLAERENISVSAIVKLLTETLLNGDIQLEKGEVKICPPPHEDCISAISNEDFEENLRYKELRLDRLVKAFEDKEYPDNIIRQQIENMIGQVRSSGKYNPRRSWDSDCGC